MNTLSRTALGALIGMAAGIAMAFITIPAVNIWLIDHNGGNDPLGRYVVVFSLAGLHGAICGFIVGLAKQRAILANIVFGGIVGLAAAGVLLLAFAAVFAVWFMIVVATGAHPLPDHINPVPAIFSMAFVGGFYGLIYLIRLAIPIVVHGALIALLINRVIRPSNLSRRCK